MCRASVLLSRRWDALMQFVSWCGRPNGFAQLSFAAVDHLDGDSRSSLSGKEGP